MIKSNKGRIKIHGKDNEILADLAITIHSLYFNEIMTKKQIEEAVRIGFKKEKEIIEEYDI